MKDNKKGKKKLLSTLPATLVLILTALLFVSLGYVYLSIRNGYTIDDLIDNIVGNLIGVLAAFLLFDILYNKLTQDDYAQDISQWITKTLIGDADTLDSFDEKDKKKFLRSTLESLMNDEDAVDAVMYHMDRYMDSSNITRIRTHFDYSIVLTTEFPKDYDVLQGIKEEKYYYVQEKLDFVIKYLTDEHILFKNNEVKIGFPFDKKSLDSGMLRSDKKCEFANCIFNENLDITPEDIKYLRTIDPSDLPKLFRNLFTFVLRIDDNLGELMDVELKSDGIVATFRVDYDTEVNEHSVRIIFHMPKLWDSVFEVTLVDPTRDPKIIFDYMPGKMDVNMYSYLDKSIASNNGADEEQNGLYDISMNGKWVYPKSGVVFTVTKKCDHKNNNQSSDAN